MPRRIAGKPCALRRVRYMPRHADDICIMRRGRTGSKWAHSHAERDNMARRLLLCHILSEASAQIRTRYGPLSIRANAEHDRDCNRKQIRIEPRSTHARVQLDLSRSRLNPEPSHSTAEVTRGYAPIPTCGMAAQCGAPQIPAKTRSERAYASRVPLHTALTAGLN